MKQLLLIAITVGLTGCASTQTFDQYQSVFRNEARIRGIEVREVQIRFGTVPYLPELNLRALAVCVPGNSLVQPTILVDRSAWYGMSESERELLTAHELFHCALGKRHSEFGIMQSRLMDVQVFTQFRRMFYNEAFGKKVSSGAFIRLSDTSPKY